MIILNVPKENVPKEENAVNAAAITEADAKIEIETETEADVKIETEATDADMATVIDAIDGDEFTRLRIYVT